MLMTCIRWLLVALLWIAVPVPVAMGQEPPSTPKQEFLSKNIQTLAGLSKVIAGTEASLAEKRDALKQAATEEETAELGTEIDQLRERLSGLREEFAKLATGVGEEDYQKIGAEVSSLSEELEEMGRLFVSEFNDATAGARELENMRAMRDTLTDREQLARKALDRLAELEGEQVDGELQEDLQRMREKWEGRLAQVTSQKEALVLRLERREAENVSMVEGLWNMLGDFTTDRGRNLLLAFLAFVVTLLVLRFLYHLFIRYGPLHRSKKGTFLVRVLDVIYGMLSTAIAVLAAFGVLYSAGDWLLLSLGLILVVGIAWTMKNTLPAVFEQVKLVLNLGPVREGERIVYNGLPWKVAALGFYCEFRNEELTGGVVRLPLRTLIDQHSRPHDNKEPWFPTSANDWAILSDGTFGKVVSQTPEQVIVLKLGGSRVYYQTPAFLELSPQNLSYNFRIAVTFGIDYQHQTDVTTSLREVFEERLTQELAETTKEDGLISLKVEFKAAGPSSLDYEVLADFSGEMAPRYNFLERAIQRICVDVCNENDLVIPFTQVTVHQAGGAADGGAAIGAMEA